MKSWLLTWNPKRWPWSEGLYSFEEMKQEFDQLGFTISKWTCGVTKSIQEGDKVYLIRLGTEPRGIIARGIALSQVFSGTHWNASAAGKAREANRIFVKFDRLCNSKNDVLIEFPKLKALSDTFCWSSQSSGISVPNHIALDLDRLIE